MKAVQQTLDHIDAAHDRRRAAAADLNDIAHSIHTRGGVQPASAAVDELVKLLFLVIAASQCPDLMIAGKVELSEVVQADRIRSGDGLQRLKAAFFVAQTAPVFRFLLPNKLGEQPVWAPDEPVRLDDADVVADVITVLSSYATNGQMDLLGEAFDVFLRGRFEHAGGPGTHMTPHTVVEAMTRIGMDITDHLNGITHGHEPQPMGDPCCGSGRFLMAMADAQRQATIAGARSFDASALVGADVSMASVAMARVNLIACGLHQSTVFTTADSITDPALDHLRGKMRLILTNPPFGAGMYESAEGIRRAATVFPELAGRRRADPALLFVARCVDLLGENGVAGIVLPDGVADGKPMADLLLGDAPRGVDVGLLGVVSLPAVTFAPTGTMVKTSIVFLGRTLPPARVFVAQANHIGHAMRNRSVVADPHGDDLAEIADDVCEVIAGRHPQGSKVQMIERSDLRSLIPAGGPRSHDAADRLRSLGGQPLSSVLRVAPKKRGSADSDLPFVSVLHIDDLGCVDWQAAQQHRPTTAGVIATSGQIIVSLLNPAKFRASVIPRITSWCSAHLSSVCSSRSSTHTPRSLCCNTRSYENKSRHWGEDRPARGGASTPTISWDALHRRATRTRPTGGLVLCGNPCQASPTTDLR